VIRAGVVLVLHFWNEMEPYSTFDQATPANGAKARAGLVSALKFPPEDAGRSLAEMAHRDLDAALQLLAARAQYITGANGAAIALRRVGKNDMLCRASTGSNAPELGALLSTEFGLSGESVRTRRPLRCDDAERDARVNREVCQQLGIASVVVMPVVNDDEVLGVFELFSGKAHAFGERDLSALQRLSEMVETAVKLARAAESIPHQGEAAEVPAGEVLASEVVDEDILEVDEPVREMTAVAEGPKLEALAVFPVVAAPQTTLQAKPQANVPTPAVPAPQKKPLFWSAALDTSAEAEKAAEPDQSHVPPMLRNLKKCEACGFPVSAGRVLCVECEEKKWRGQLRMPRLAAPQKAASPATEAPATPVARLMAAAQSGTTAAAAPVLARQSAPAVSAVPIAAKTMSPDVVKESNEIPAQPVATPVPSHPAVLQTAATAVAEPQSVVPEREQSPAFVLSAGLAPSQSWFSANKYIFGAILLIGATVAAILLLR
jgi:GAF domain-containing protein